MCNCSSTPVEAHRLKSRWTYPVVTRTRYCCEDNRTLVERPRCEILFTPLHTLNNFYHRLNFPFHMMKHSASYHLSTKRPPWSCIISFFKQKLYLQRMLWKLKARYRNREVSPRWVYCILTFEILDFDCDVTSTNVILSVPVVDYKVWFTWTWPRWVFAVIKTFCYHVLTIWFYSWVYSQQKICWVNL